MTCPALTWSPDRAVIFVSRPSTCDCSVAERLDLMVATYSLLCGTGASETATVCTGIACIPPAAGGGAAFLQPASASPKKTQLIPTIRFNAVVLACFSFSRAYPAGTPVCPGFFTTRDCGIDLTAQPACLPVSRNRDSRRAREKSFKGASLSDGRRQGIVANYSPSMHRCCSKARAPSQSEREMPDVSLECAPPRFEFKNAVRTRFTLASLELT